MSDMQFELKYKDLYSNAFDFKVKGFELNDSVFNICFWVESFGTDYPFHNGMDAIYITRVSVGEVRRGNLDAWVRTDEATELQANIPLCMHIGYLLLEKLKSKKVGLKEEKEES